MNFLRRSSNSIESHFYVEKSHQKYTILYSKEYDYLVMTIIYYHIETPFNGLKIIVFENTTNIELKNKTEIDPHFLETSNVIARFKGNVSGYINATNFCQMSTGKEISKISVSEALEFRRLENKCKCMKSYLNHDTDTNFRNELKAKYEY